ncbi:host specificity factor TipJ family phage tail protein, partial [bacterium]|nr:host specificity factor TipJ family phage tail protein [bacterium]
MLAAAYVAECFTRLKALALSSTNTELFEPQIKEWNSLNMPTIYHHKDPSNITKPDIYEVPNGTNVIKWMARKWADSAEMSDGLSISILLNCKEIYNSDDENADPSILDLCINGTDSISIINRPAASVIIVAVAVVAAAALMIALMPSLPGDAGGGSESPNNKLQAARNEFRPGEARPEIFGANVSYPDFLQPIYFEYVNNLKILSELCYVGEGSYALKKPDGSTGEVRFGETPFNSIPGSSYAIYEPGDVLPAELLTIHRTSEAVDGQEPVAPDDESIQQSDQVDSVVSGGPGNNTLTLVSDSTLAFDMALVIGEYITLYDDLLDATIGTFEITNLTTVVDQTVIEIDSIAGIAVLPANIVISKTDSSGVLQNYVGWFTIPGDNADEVWFNWQMPSGIRSEKGKKITIDLEFEIESLASDGVTPTGLNFVKQESITGNTADGQFRTTKFTKTEFPSLPAAQYRARARRLTDQFSGSAAQQVKMEQFVSVTPYTELDNSTGTVIAFERRATTFAVSASGNKNNLDVIRKLPTYNRLTDFYDVNTLTETRSFADAVAYTLIVGSGRDSSTIDLAGLYEIYDGLLHEELGYFDFTFDNENVGLGERIESICNVARVTPFRDGGLYNFTRDEEKLIRSAMFNRRVTVGNSSTQNIQLQRPDDKDSVALTYVDPTLNVEKTLYRRVDSGGNIVDDGQGRQALKIKLAGCRGFFQAWNRVNLEMRRIIYQRWTVNDTVLRDGMSVGLMERVGWVDPNDVNLFSGEIIGFSGNDYDTTERFIPETGIDYLVYITDDKGNVSNTVAATARL